MGLAHSPRIVTSGMTLCLDPGNPKSYDGSSSKWYDALGSSTKTFDLAGTYSYKPANTSIFLAATTGTSISNATVNLATSKVSVSAWVKVYSHGNWNDFVVNNWPANGWALYASSTDWTFGVGKNATGYYSYGSHGSSTAFTHLVGTYDGTTIKLYVNGIPVSTTASLSEAVLDRDFKLRVGGLNDPGDREISHIAVYNRDLSQEEVLQNFNALRGRYGI